MMELSELNKGLKRIEELMVLNEGIEGIK